MAILAAGTLAGARTVGWAFTDRRIGNSRPPYEGANLAAHVGDDSAHVAANRERLREHLDERGVCLATMSQVHGNAVAAVEDPGEAGTCDGLVTATPGLALLTQVADCVPVLLADTEGAVVAAVHAGWRGAVADVVGRTVDAMHRMGADHIEGLIGPAICGACYEVGEDVRDAVAAVLPEAAGTTPQGTPSVDLRAGLAARLTRLGVASDVVGPCTFETPDLFSFRRDGRTGRQAGVIWIHRG